MSTPEGEAFEVRPFCGGDTAALLDCWGRALPRDSVTLDLFERRILLDRNFEPGSLVVAQDAGGAIAGFVSCFVLRHPIEKSGHREDTGFITVLGADADDGTPRQRALVRALVAAATDFFRARGRTQMLLSPYTPNYFVPGLDKERYAGVLACLREEGFEEYIEALAADACIATFEVDERTRSKEKALAAEGIVIRPYGRGDLVDYLAFLRDTMPGPWLEDARRNLTDLTRGLYREDAIFLAVDRGRIIGFCQYEHEHFGPFGVSDDYQGRGVGSVLLARTMERMRMNGCHSAWVLWTGERALEGVYGRLGFCLTRRFALLKKTLATE